MDRVLDLQIRETDNYDQFVKLLGNRDVTAARIAAIKESILRIGYQPSVIIVNEKMEVIDGQGRIAACKALNIPCYYVVKPGLTIEDCISMNIKMKNWSDLDYLRSYAERGVKPYEIMMQMLEEFPLLSWQQLIVIQGRGSEPATTEAMRNGRLRFTELSYTQYERARWISQMIPAIKKSPLNNRSAIETLIRLDRYKLIDKHRMMESIEKYADSIERGGSRASDTLQILNELYNYNRRSKKFFADDYKRAALAAGNESRKTKERTA